MDLFAFENSWGWRQNWASFYVDQECIWRPSARQELLTDNLLLESVAQMRRRTDEYKQKTF